MSCSKLFSGDLPELTYEVIKYLQNDHSTLHSCILVNRFWCRLTIPLLWENPFSISTRKYKFIIDIYLHNSKTKLNVYNINNNLLPSNSTLFNHLNFLKYLNTFEFITSVNEWKILTLKNKHLNSSISDICLLLFKMFIENEVNLHTLEIENSLANEYSSRYLEYYNFSNTLNTIIFYFIDLKVIINQVKVFEQLNVLESVHIVYCSSLNDSFIQQIITLTKPFKLKSLFMGEILQIESIQLLLQKSGDYLENIGFGFCISLEQLIELITKYCKNIKFLDLGTIKNPIIYLIVSIIENIKQKLNHLTIHILDENSQDILINKSLIDQRGQRDLYDLKDEVEEFKLYNIRVRRWNNLFFISNIYNFLKEVD
ncbi:hypothetical protein C1646_766408 [Rhizophagus diaphanus]|nr:hypothetical protein C1646_766408 [Rhizophagus diaphanus] [Rhizophagus sp. MUCL 43196]